jgi:hypothetical protein
LHGPEIFLVGFKYAMREFRSLVPVGILEIKIEEELGLLAALLEIGGLFQELGGLADIALRRMRPRFDDDCGLVAGLEFQRLVREFFTFSMVAAGQSTLRSGHISLDCIPRLAHGLIQIG